MSTSKHIDKICIAAIVIVLIVTALFMNGSRLGISSSGRNMGYEERLFETDKVHSIDIVMNDWDSFIETCENEEYSVCTAVIDGEKFSNIGIRAKGNTSLSSVKSMGSERYSLKLEFDQYDDNKSYYGLDKLCLNNLIQDNTMMKDYLAYQMMYDFGVETPLCSYVYITVNGEDWGLYLAVEGVEDSFLERNYGSDTGEMYKPDSLSFGGGRGNGQDFDINELDFDQTSDTENSDTNLTSDTENSDTNLMDGGEFDFGRMGGGNFDFSQVGGGDFDFSQISGDFGATDEEGSDGGFDFGGFGGFGGMGSDDVKLKYIDDNPDSYSNIFNNAKTDITDADKDRLISSIKSLSEYSDLEDVLNMEEVLRYFVVHNFVDNGDSYTGSMIHNYYLHESDGQLSMIPWDYNLAYGTFMGMNASESVNASIDDPLSGGDLDSRPMVGWIFSDEKYTQRYHELFEEFINEWYDSGKMVSLIEDTAEMIRPYVEKDPTKFCTTEEFESGVNALSTYVSLRGEAVSRQLDGDDSKVSCTGLNISDMGTMDGSGGNSFGGGPGGGPGGNFNPFGGDSSEGGDSSFTPPNDGDSSEGNSNNNTDDSRDAPQTADSQTSSRPGNRPGGGPGGNFNPFSGDSSEGGDSSSFTPPGDSGSFNPFGGSGGDSGNFTPPGGDSSSFTPPGGGNTDLSAMSSAFSNIKTIALIAISAVVLIIGLVIVIKKKERV